MVLINLIGNIAGNLTGYGSFTRGFWRALQRSQGVDFQCLFTEYREPAEIAVNAEKCRRFPGRVINIWLQVGPGEARLAQFPGEKVAYTMFETDHLPDGWVAGLCRADRVFTPSDWGRQVMIDNGVPPGTVHVIPGGVERISFAPWGRRLPQLESPAFKFLLIGTYQIRKGYAELFSAFRRAFADRLDVELIVKANTSADPEKNRRQRAMIREGAPSQLRFVEGQMDDFGIAALYRSCDCFVFPSRGEGCGLPLFEAMACGIPVIATNCSGHSQLLNQFPGRFSRIDTVRRPVLAPDFLKWYRWSEGAGTWYEPGVESLTEALRLAEAGAIFRDNGQTALEVRQRFSWDASVDAALHVLL